MPDMHLLHLKLHIITDILRQNTPKTLKRTEKSILSSDDKGENYELFDGHIVTQKSHSVNDFFNLVNSKFW